MKQKHLLTKSLLLLAVMLMGVGTAWAADPITFTLSGTNGDAVESVSSGDVTITFGKGTNTSNAPTWYDNGSALRFYSGNTITFASSGAKIEKVVLTNTESQLVGGNNGTNYPSSGTYSVSNKIETWTADTPLESFTVSITNKPRLTKIEVYLEEENNKEACDLALTGAPVALLFDLYKNSGAQTISYTTSSTGDVTCSESEYVETSINTTNKTITVTPIKKTSAIQTIAVNQADDETYKAGTATFTVTITDSTPETGSWALTELADLTEDDVFVIVGNNGSTYAMSNGVSSSNPPSAVSVTIEDNKITSDVVDNMKWNISGDATYGYTFYPDGDSENWLYCINQNNGVRVGSGDAKHFTLTTGTNPGYLTTTETTKQRYIGIYNSSDWRCYDNINTNITGQTFAFYKYVDNSVVQAPSITVSNVSIDYDATEGEIVYTLNNEVAGGSLSVSVTEGDWLTLGSGTNSPISFSCSENTATTTRTATVTLTYTYGNNETVTKAVTVTQAGNPNAVVNISNITAAGTYTVKGTIVAKSARGFIVGDGTGYVYYYNQNYTPADYNIGDKVKLSGSVVEYGGVFEFNSSTTITAATESNYQEENPTILTGADMDTRVASTTPTQLSNYVQYQGKLTVNDTHYNITDIVGATTAIGSISYPIGTDFTSLNGKTVKVTGYYVGISTSKYYNTMIGSIEEVVSTVPTITVAPATVEVDADEHDGTLDLTYENLTISDMTDFGIQYYDAEGEEVDAPDWIEVLVAEQDPSIGEGYVVSYYMVENEGEARTAYFKVFAMGDEDFVYSDLVTVTQAAYVAPEVAIGNFIKVTSTEDITSGQYLIVYEAEEGNGCVAFDGSLETLDAINNTIAVNIENNKIVATTTNAKSVFNIDVTAGTLQSASGKYIGVSSNSNGLKTSDNADYINAFSIVEGEAVIAADFEGSTMSLRFNKAANQNRFRYFKNFGQESIQLYKFVAAVTVTAAGYATYCSENALDFSAVEGLTAYKATIADNKVSFETVTEVPAGEGVLLKGAEGTYDVPVIASADELEGNAFIGKTEETVVNEKGIYVLLNGSAGVGFYKTTADSFTIGAHTAYLPATIGGEGARSFIAIDEATAIEGIAAETMANGEIYNLQGQRVVKAQKGLYIINGKKVVIK